MDHEPYRDSIHIDAPPEIVFQYFVNPDALVQWMGDEAFVDPRPGGRFTLVFHDRAVEGRYLEVHPPTRLVISWGRRGSRVMPPASSVLEVILTPDAGGTRVSIVHSGLPDIERERHALGWRHYLDRLSRVAAGAAVEAHTVPDALTTGAD